VLDIVAQRFGLPDALERFAIVAMAVGFFLTLLLAWYHGERGTQKATGTELLIIALLLTIGGVVAWRLALAPTAMKSGQSAASTASQAPAAVDQHLVDPHSIAVLPFVDMSQGKDQEYFSDGLSEQLLNQLAQIPQLRVIARTSSFSFKGREVDIATIAKALNVANVLEGSVRKSDNTVRITAQLIRTADSTHLWSQTYDRELTDIFKVQDEIADAIANALELKITGHEVATSNAASVNPAAFDAYLQGRSFVAKRYLANLDEAIAAFDRTIALEPRYSAAFSGRAFAQLLRPLWGANDYAAALVKARDSANQALQFDPDNAEAYMVRGMVAAYNRDATSAGADLDRALALAPANVDVINMAGDIHTYLGDLSEAERLKRRAITLDPLAFVHPMNLSDVLAEQARYPEALVAAQQAIALGAKDFGFDRQVLAQVRSGQFTQARASVEQDCAITGPTASFCEGNRILVLAESGQRAQAEVMLDALVRDIRSGKHPVGYYGPAQLSWLYSEVADFAKAAAMQREALDHNNWFPFLLTALTYSSGGARLPEEISNQPDWIAVWNDPRMKDLMAVYRRNLHAWRASRH
jgi:TolB-like protein/Tfp pilus assembly protein PilF